MPNIFSNPKTKDFYITNTTDGYIALEGAFIPPSTMVANTSRAQPVKYTEIGGDILRLKELYETSQTTRDLFDDGSIVFTTIEGVDDLVPAAPVDYSSDITALDGRLDTAESTLTSLDSRLDALESAGGGEPNIRSTYLYENDWTQWSISGGGANTSDWYYSVNGGVIYGGMEDYDSGTIRGCLRLHSGANSSQYTAIGMTGFKPSVNTTFSIEAKISIKSGHVGSTGVFNVFMGFAESYILPSVTKHAIMKAVVNQSGRTLSASVIGSSSLNTSAGSLANEAFTILKVVVTGLTDIKFYKDDVLIATHNTVATNYSYMPVFGTTTTVSDTINTVSPFIFMDWVRIKAVYTGGR